METKNNEKSIIEHLLQDMHVKLRDIDDFKKHLEYKEILARFQKGYQDEYAKS